MPGTSSPPVSERFELSRIDFDALEYDYEMCSTYEFTEAALAASETTPALEKPKLPSPTQSMDQAPTSAKNETQIRRHFQGWRMGVTLCAITTGVVLVINLSVMIWVAAGAGLKGGLRTLQQGSCKEVKNLSSWLHLAINALSTLLLGASNYTMQCLSSPTREDINAAHRKHKWLDVGILSFRNLKHNFRGKGLLWCLIALSSVPLHLLYNSVVFSTLSIQEYYISAASVGLGNGMDLDWTLLNHLIVPGPSQNATTVQNLKPALDWQKLDNRDCIKAYGQGFVSAFGDLLLILPTANATERNFLFPGVIGDTFGSFEWMCNANSQSRCSMNTLLSEAANWTISSENRYFPDYEGVRRLKNQPVQFCLSQPIKENCQLQISLVILGVVVASNATKALCMLLAIRLQESQPLVTLGDAIASFMQDPDRSTDGMCLASKKSFNGVGKTKLSMSSADTLCRSELGSLRKADWTVMPMEWAAHRHRWSSSVSSKRWLICTFLCIAPIGSAGGLLSLGINNIDPMYRSLSQLWHLGYGNVTSQSIIQSSLPGNGGLLSVTIIANSPQIFLSFLYLTYNGLFTCMLQMNEWTGYAHKRNPLRVTNPTKSQRSTYRLQLPYKYGVSLLLLCGTLHWLVSQSLFLANISVFNSEGVEDTGASFTTLGYSNIAIATVIPLATVMLLLGILTGFRRYPLGIPLAGSCSAAISAACHRPEGDADAAENPLMWGAVETEGNIGHCCFTSFEVEKPVVGRLYAGLKSD